MRVLQFLPYAPCPPLNGGRVRSLSIMKRLACEHEITLVCYTKPSENAHLEELRQFCSQIWPIPRPESPNEHVLRMLAFSPFPLHVRFFHSQYARELLRDLLTDNYDVVHVETYYITPNLPRHLAKPIVLAESNIEHELMMQMARLAHDPSWRILFRLDALKQRLWERAAWERATHCAATTRHDAEKIAEVIGWKKVSVVANGVDSCTPPADADSTCEGPTLLFVGNFLHRPNVDGIIYFIDEIFPIIRNTVPEVRLAIVGHGPPPEVKVHHSPPYVVVRGYVENLTGVFDSTTISICPIRIGSGSRVKILEALGRGHATVSTTIGCEGLELQDGQHLLIADTPPEFARAVCQLVASPELRLTLGTRARQFVLREYNWDRSVNSLVACYEKAKAAWHSPLRAHRWIT